MDNKDYELGMDIVKLMGIKVNQEKPLLFRIMNQHQYNTYYFATAFSYDLELLKKLEQQFVANGFTVLWNNYNDGFTIMKKEK